MKLIFIGMVLFLGSQVWGAETRDIVFKTRFGDQGSQEFIQRVRSFLINNSFGDPYNQTLKKTLKIDLTQALDDLPQGTQNWIKELQSFFKLKIFESNYSLIIEDFGYQVDGFHSQVWPTTFDTNRVDYITNNYIKGAKFSAKRISFQVELKKTHTGEPIKFNIDLVHPQFTIDPALLMELPMGWLLTVLPNNLAITLNSINVANVFAKIVEHPELINLTVEGLIIPEVSVLIGSKEIRLDHDKLINFLSATKEELKRGIIDILKIRVAGRLDNILKDSPKELKLPRSYVLESVISGIFKLETLDANIKSISSIEVDGQFCPVGQVDKEIKACRGVSINAKNRRSIDAATFDQSMDEMDRNLLEEKANIALSVSEHYFNQLIEATIDAGLWKKVLSGKAFALGSEKAFVLADEEGENFTLYLDVIHKLKRAQRVLTGWSEIRFPIKLKIGLQIVDQEGLPHLIIKVNEVATTSDLVINGLPEYDLESTVKYVRFRNKVVQSVLEDVAELKNSQLLNLELGAFKGTYLERLNFYSDGKGRGNATLNLGPSRNPFLFPFFNY